MQVGLARSSVRLGSLARTGSSSSSSSVCGFILLFEVEHQSMKVSEYVMVLMVS